MRVGNLLYKDYVKFRFYKASEVKFINPIYLRSVIGFLAIPL